jgi:hypothetical protein
MQRELEERRRKPKEEVRKRPKNVSSALIVENTS